MPENTPGPVKEEIAFEEGPKKQTPALMDAEIREMKDKAYAKIEKQQVDAEVRAEAGIAEPPPKASESIHPTLPKLVFRHGSRILQCEKFKLEEDDADVLAHHLSVIVGPVNSKLFSAFMIFVIIFGKVAECWDAVKRLFKRNKEEAV